MGTIIRWTDQTWNPVAGCSKVSDGCKNCYAERISLRFGRSTKPWAAANAEENVVLHPERLDKPRRLKTPSMIFVNSMSDLFHPLVPDAYVDRVFAVMAACPQHTFQILTKRPERAAEWPGPWGENVWMGTSVEDERVVVRIDALRRCGALTRFVSFEPLIGPVATLDLSGIHWAIVGGESGPKHRPMADEWARAIRDACLSQGVAFFFKQHAAFHTEREPTLDGVAWEQYPEIPAERHVGHQPALLPAD